MENGLAGTGGFDGAEVENLRAQRPDSPVKAEIEQPAPVVEPSVTPAEAPAAVVETPDAPASPGV